MSPSDLLLVWLYFVCSCEDWMEGFTFSVGFGNTGAAEGKCG